MLIQEDTNKIIEIASRLSGKSIDRVLACGSGRNSRIFQVQCKDARYALKFYRRQPDNLLCRLEAESKALQFFQRHGIKSAPRLIACSWQENCSLLEWVRGSPVNHIGVKEINLAASFLKDLHSLRNKEGALNLPLGREACLCGCELLRQLEMRLDKLKKAAVGNLALKNFIENNFAPAIDTIGSWAKKCYVELGFNFSGELDKTLQTLSPVDFGFHNTLSDNGKIIFIDFEYFGWADPVNLVADTLLHPGMELSTTLKNNFFESMLNLYGNDPDFLNRLRALYPLYGLRWAAIMLNRFLPEYLVLGAEQSLEHKKKKIDEEKLARVNSLVSQIYKTYKGITV